MDKIKVLQVNKLYYPEVGGIEKTLQLIAEGLNEKTDLEVLVCQKKGKGITEQINGVRVHRASSFGVVASVPISISFIWKLRQMSKGVDIVHYHMPFPLGDLACLLSGYKGKVVAYWHSDVVKKMDVSVPAGNECVSKTCGCDFYWSKGSGGWVKISETLFG